MAKFRFQDLEIWKEGIRITDELFDIADQLESKKLFRFAEQLRGAALSITNNIAEGSGSTSKKEFANFLNFARRSVFENANMLIIFSRKKYLSEEMMNVFLDRLVILSKRITAFQRAL